MRLQISSQINENCYGNTVAVFILHSFFQKIGLNRNNRFRVVQLVRLNPPQNFFQRKKFAIQKFVFIRMSRALLRPLDKININFFIGITGRGI